MPRIGTAALAIALTLGAARADIAPPPLEFVNIEAGGLDFLVIRRDYRRPAHPSAQLVGCVDGHPNCALARARNLVGRSVRGLDGRAFASADDVAGAIVDAFHSPSAPATIELDFEPVQSGGEPDRIAFARR